MLVTLWAHCINVSDIVGLNASHTVLMRGNTLNSEDTAPLEPAPGGTVCAITSCCGE